MDLLTELIKSCASLLYTDDKKRKKREKYISTNNIFLLIRPNRNCNSQLYIDKKVAAIYSYIQMKNEKKIGNISKIIIIHHLKCIYK